MNSQALSSRTSIAVISALLAASPRTVAAGEIHRLDSPDGRIQVSFQLPAPGSRGQPRWSATFRGKPVLTNCALGLATADAGELMAGARIASEQRRLVNERIPVLFGKADHASDRFQEARLTLESAAPQRTELIFRCYDDAIALRYELTADAKAGSVTITDESTSLGLTGEPTAFVQYLENFKTPHEHNVAETPFREIRPGALLDLPLTLSWPDGTFAAITEAALRRYAGMALMRRSEEAAQAELVCQLTPRPDGTKVFRPLPLQTPWRVVLIADRPGALLESGTIYCLNEPSVIQDVSWIKPGKITFPW